MRDEKYKAKPKLHLRKGGFLDVLDRGNKNEMERWGKIEISKKEEITYLPCIFAYQGRRRSPDNPRLSGRECLRICKRFQTQGYCRISGQACNPQKSGIVPALFHTCLLLFDRFATDRIRRLWCSSPALRRTLPKTRRMPGRICSLLRNRTLPLLPRRCDLPYCKAPMSGSLFPHRRIRRKSCIVLEQGRRIRISGSLSRLNRTLGEERRHERSCCNSYMPDSQELCRTFPQERRISLN